jgi:hypothetical protein
MGLAALSIKIDESTSELIRKISIPLFELYENVGSHIGLAALSMKFFFSRRNSYDIFFGSSRIFAKSRVGSEGVTGLRTRGRPPRLDDRKSYVLARPPTCDMK